MLLHGNSSLCDPNEVSPESPPFCANQVIVPFPTSHRAFKQHCMGTGLCLGNPSHSYRSASHHNRQHRSHWSTAGPDQLPPHAGSSAAKRQARRRPCLWRRLNRSGATRRWWSHCDTWKATGHTARKCGRKCGSLFSNAHCHEWIHRDSGRRSLRYTAFLISPSSNQIGPDFSAWQLSS